MSGRWYVGLLVAVSLVGCQEKEEPEEKVNLIKLPEAVNVNTAPPATPAPPPPAEVVPAVQPVATTTQAPAPVATTTPKPPAPRPTVTTPKPAPTNSIAQCCASLHQSAKSASFEQQPIYASAAQTCDAMGSAGLGTVRAMTLSVGIPDACR